MEAVNKSLIGDFLCSQKKTYSQVSEILKGMLLFHLDPFKDTSQKNQYQHVVKQVTVVYIYIYNLGPKNHTRF